MNTSASDSAFIDPCAATGLTDYDLGLHVGAVFILVAASLLGSTTPVVYSILRQWWLDKHHNHGHSHSHSQSRKLPVFWVRLGLLFGAGTILATGFIHMLIPATLNLTSPCLSSAFSTDYQAFSGLFAMLAMLLMQLMQFGITSYYEKVYAPLANRGKKNDTGHGVVMGPLSVSALIDDHPNNMIEPARRQHDIEHHHNHHGDGDHDHPLEHQETAAVIIENSSSSLSPMVLNNNNNNSNNNNSNFGDEVTSSSSTSTAANHHQQHHKHKHSHSSSSHPHSHNHKQITVTASCTDVIEICHGADETCQLPDACESKQCESHHIGLGHRGGGGLEESCEEPEHHHHHHFHLHQLSKKNKKVQQRKKLHQQQNTDEEVGGVENRTAAADVAVEEECDSIIDDDDCPSFKLGKKYRKRIAVALLETGIASHSIIIGIALGVSSGKEFTGLLIALCFHQFFEGLALGTTVVEAEFTSNLLSLALTLVYGVTTPLGIAIGIAIHSTYNPNSPEALLTQGIFDSVSAGILIYTALVELITPEITNSRPFRNQTRVKQFLQFMALYLGATVMAVIGRFA